MPFNKMSISLEVGPTWEWLLDQPQWVRDHPRLIEAVGSLEGQKLNASAAAQLQGILRDMDRSSE